MRPYLEKTHHNKRAGGVAQEGGPEFKPQYCKKKKKEIADSKSWTRNVYDKPGTHCHFDSYQRSLG
jgi:hypothetical protein